MTKSEALSVLKNAAFLGTEEDAAKVTEAIDTIEGNVHDSGKDADCISRQAAIDALRAIKQGLWEIDIPSPTVPEYVEHHEQIKNMMEIVDGWIKRIKEEPTAHQWIPCRERLPKYGKTVLITNDKGNVSYGMFRGVEYWEEDGDSVWVRKKNTLENVIAWMPLPEPYTEDEDEVN